VSTRVPRRVARCAFDSHVSRTGKAATSSSTWNAHLRFKTNTRH
jgi:hypothetical protein